jgi:hypothetical protein
LCRYAAHQARQVSCHNAAATQQAPTAGAPAADSEVSVIWRRRRAAAVAHAA